MKGFHAKILVIISVVLLMASFYPASGTEDRFIKVSDISYRQEYVLSEYAKKMCTLDLYYPKSAENYPTIVFFHGGSLRRGTRDMYLPLAKRFAAESIGVVLASYRLSPKVKHPIYNEDAAAAVAWTFKNITSYGGDAGRIFISGHSAGGYLAAIVGMDEKYLEKHNLSVQQIAGIIPISGQMMTHSTILNEQGVPEGRIVIDEYAPIYHSQKVGPPCLCICGDNDLALRADENKFFIAGRKSAGNKNAFYLEVRERDHISIVSKISEADDEVAQAILDFIRQRK